MDHSTAFVPTELFDQSVDVDRASGNVTEPYATALPESGLAVEWEWENSPEVTLVVVDSVADAVELCNRYSPRFVASLIAGDSDEHDRFYAAVDAPFVGDGFTRWVDGQYALDAPELGLSNWQGGRMLGRGAIREQLEQADEPRLAGHRFVGDDGKIAHDRSVGIVQWNAEVADETHLLQLVIVGKQLLQMVGVVIQLLFIDDRFAGRPGN